MGQGAERRNVTQTKINYTGQKLDGSGLINYNARMYDPAVGRFLSADSIVPATAGGGASTNNRLTVDFHEAASLNAVNNDNLHTLTDGFWFQLTAKARAETDKPFGPRVPQTLNRYSYVLDNPMRYNDPTGHGADGEVVNHSSQPIIVVGTKNGKGYIAVVQPGESSKKYMEDADFWQPVDGGLDWIKVGNSKDEILDSTQNPGHVRYKRSNIPGCFICPSSEHEWGEKDNPDVHEQDCDDATATCNDDLPYYQMQGCGTLPGSVLKDPSTHCGFILSAAYRNAEDDLRENRSHGAH